MATINTHHYIDQVLQNAWVKKGIDVYSSTKRSHPLVETTFDKVEGAVQGAAGYVQQKSVGVQEVAKQQYDTYVAPPINYAGEKYERASTKVRSAYTTSRDWFTYIATITIGAAVVSAQVTMTVVTSTLSVASSVFTSARGVCSSAIGKIQTKQQSIAQWNPQALQEIHKFGQTVSEKVTDTTNSLLDITDSLLERYAGVNMETKPDAAVRERLWAYWHSLLGIFSSAAHEKVIDPANAKIGQLSERFIKKKQTESGEKSNVRQRNTPSSSNTHDDVPTH